MRVESRMGSWRAAAAGYLIGTLPSADIAAGLTTRGAVDLRAAGSGNPGALNALRLLGRRAGLAVTVADIGKGVAACLLGRALAGERGAHAGGVAAVAGHCDARPDGVVTSISPRSRREWHVARRPEPPSEPSSSPATARSSLRPRSRSSPGPGSRRQTTVRVGSSRRSFRGDAQSAGVPLAVTTHQRPPCKSTLWHRISPGPSCS